MKARHKASTDDTTDVGDLSASQTEADCIRLVVHRGTREIGGNCVELATHNGYRVILDSGRPLDAPPDSNTRILPPSLDLSLPTHAVLLTHAHQDHYGLLEELPANWPVFCGAPTERLIRITAAIARQPILQTFQNWVSGETFEVGPFCITPILTDHSAFDAHMLLIAVHGKRLLYSGDFRHHGRKAVLVQRLTQNPPASLDALIMEGTNLGTEKSCTSEADLTDRFIDLFQTTTGRVFVAWSAQNIDRTVTLYKACRSAGRTLVVDLYTAEVMEALAEFGRLPRPGWRDIRVVITSSMARMYRASGREAFVERMVRYGISARALAENPSRWVVMLRRSLLRDYQLNNVLPTAQDRWCWSMWSGYLSNDDGQQIARWFERQGTRGEHIHTSGHAAPATLKAFAKAMNAKVLVPIHGSNWDEHCREFTSVQRLKDGETLYV